MTEEQESWPHLPFHFTITHHIFTDITAAQKSTESCAGGERRKDEKTLWRPPRMRERCRQQWERRQGLSVRMDTQHKQLRVWRNLGIPGPQLRLGGRAKFPEVLGRKAAGQGHLEAPSLVSLEGSSAWLVAGVPGLPLPFQQIRSPDFHAFPHISETLLPCSCGFVSLKDVSASVV